MGKFWINSLRGKLIRNIKNGIGPSIDSKVVVFAVDDYGNVRLDSRQARERMDKAGLKIESRYDYLDALETEEDLDLLFRVLDKVKDKNGNPAIFTALSLPANIDFEKMSESGNEEYVYESLPTTFSKLKGYERVWSMWQEGMKKGLLRPQFHGREHLNLKVFRENLRIKEYSTKIALENRSYTSIATKPYPNISYTAAFDISDPSDNVEHKMVIEDGLNLFEQVFGFRSISFNSPGGRESSELHETLKNGGVDFIETPIVKNEHLGNNSFKKKFHYTGKRNAIGQTFMVRNCLFEPGVDINNYDWVAHTMKQIANAFFWKKPAIISSHRVNFCGHIDPANRDNGLNALDLLLKSIVKEWPDVEFLSLDKLCTKMRNN